MHHITENDGNFFEPNRSIPFFSFKRPEKICGGIINSPVVVSASMGLEMKATDFAVNAISVLNRLYFCLFGFFKAFFFETFSRCSAKAFRIAG
jgi:hypothetical protein